VICVHLVTQAGDLHELPIQFQDIPHFAQATRINLNFEHGATNVSGPVKGMQSISHEKMIAEVAPATSRLHLAQSCVNDGRSSDETRRSVSVGQ
jgi:hypothetical protein